MTPALRLLSHLLEEEIPSQGWPRHAVLRLLDVLVANRGLAAALRELIEQGERLPRLLAAVDDLELALAPATLDPVRVAVMTMRGAPGQRGHVAQLAASSSPSSWEYSDLLVAHAAYTLGYALYRDGQQLAAASWMEAAGEHDSSVAGYGLVVESLALMQRDPSHALNKCLEGARKYVDGAPNCSTLLLCRELAIRARCEAVVCQIWGMLARCLQPRKRQPEERAWALTDVGVCVGASGHVDDATAIIAAAEKVDPMAAARRRRKLGGVLLASLSAQTSTELRAFAERLVSAT